jgi:hypothetical protein
MKALSAIVFDLQRLAFQKQYRNEILLIAENEIFHWPPIGSS